MTKSIAVDPAKCIHCGLCLSDCMMGCLEFGEGKIPRYADGGRDRCVGCQHCMAVCPRGALSFGGIDPADCASSGAYDPDALLSLVRSRRSVRRYRDESLDPATLAKLREMLAYPPTGGNAPSLHITLVSTKEKMREIAETTYRAMETAAGAKPLYRFCLDRREAGDDIVFRGAPSMAIASVDRAAVVAGCETVDPVISLSYLELYATSLGLGTLWDDLAATLAHDLPAVRAAFGIPEGHDVGFVLLLGKPAVRYPRAVKKSPDCVEIL